ncbi:MAG: hypothetical protein GY765_23545 [bacterium]|nr:hypothetical protein [bacterium]
MNWKTVVKLWIPFFLLGIVLMLSVSHLYAKKCYCQSTATLFRIDHHCLWDCFPRECDGFDILAGSGTCVGMGVCRTNIWFYCSTGDPGGMTMFDPCDDCGARDVGSIEE